MHSHGAINPTIYTADRGIWAIKWSFLGLLATALLQTVVFLFSGSAALLADTVHNLGDATTAGPLWIAFLLAKRLPTKRFTYGYGRVEDLAGLAILMVIFLTVVLAGYQSVHRLLNPQPVDYIGAVMAASVVGFLGNEAVAIFRVKVGKEIGSAALVAEGRHARVDGLTSLAVLVGAVGVWLGFPLADPIVGLAITGVVVLVVWESGKSIFTRLLDGVDPGVMDEIKHAVEHAPEVQEVSEVRVRWLGHRLHAELSIAVSPVLSVEKGHAIAMAVRHQLLHHLRYLADATIHVDRADAAGAEYHRIGEHAHDDLPGHSH